MPRPVQGRISSMYSRKIRKLYMKTFERMKDSKYCSMYDDTGACGRPYHLTLVKIQLKILLAIRVNVLQFSKLRIYRFHVAYGSVKAD